MGPLKIVKCQHCNDKVGLSLVHWFFSIIPTIAAIALTGLVTENKILPLIVFVVMLSLYTVPLYVFWIPFVKRGPDRGVTH